MSNVVDRLLASPRYGERWGRHWMDVWRYSDWAGWEGGGQIRDSQPHIWQWRDWIIESLNEDKGYDRMLKEMLAADEIAPDDPSALRATGFLVRNYKMLSREKWLQDTVDHTFLAFQGVTIGWRNATIICTIRFCKRNIIRFGPFSRRIRCASTAFPAKPDTKKDGLMRTFDADSATPTFLLIRGDDRTPDKTPLPPAFPASLGGTFTPESVKLPLAAYSPDRRDFVRDEELSASAAIFESEIQGNRDAAIRSRRCRSRTRPVFESFHVGENGTGRQRGGARPTGSVAGGSETRRVDGGDARRATRRRRKERFGRMETSRDGSGVSPAPRREMPGEARPPRRGNGRPRRRFDGAGIRCGNQTNCRHRRGCEGRRRSEIAALDRLHPAGIKTYPVTSTGRRTAFADGSPTAKTR